MNTRRPVGVILHRKPGTTVSRSSTSLVWGWAASTAVLVSLIFAMMTPWNDPDSKSQIGAARGKTGSSFRKNRHMMDARKLLINLLYRATAQSSELPGWSHRETKNPRLAERGLFVPPKVGASNLAPFIGGAAAKVNLESVLSGAMALGLAGPTKGGPHEIGRASCRERVCQYV